MEQRLLKASRAVYAALVNLACLFPVHSFVLLHSQHVESCAAGQKASCKCFQACLKLFAHPLPLEFSGTAAVEASGRFTQPGQASNFAFETCLFPVQSFCACFSCTANSANTRNHVPHIKSDPSSPKHSHESRNVALALRQLVGHPSQSWDRNKVLTVACAADIFMT